MISKSLDKIKVVKDLFAKCDYCKRWVRVLKEDNKEDQMRMIPLYSRVIGNKELWICDNCWDKQEEAEGGGGEGDRLEQV